MRIDHSGRAGGMISRRELGGLLVSGPLLAADRPNFVFVLTDDQGWPETSVRMHPDIAESCDQYLETPNIARLTREGMRFSAGYSPAPLCTPTRRSIQFGMTPARQRGTEFIGDFRPQGRLAIPQALKSVDPRYRCAHFGKWGEAMSGRSRALDQKMEANPTALGYDESDGVTGNETGGLGERTATVVHDDPKRTFSVTRRAVDFMERQVRDHRPFYLQVSYYAPHRQNQVLAQTLEKYRRKGRPTRGFDIGFAAMMEDLDTAFGRVLTAVDKLGIAGRTYIILTSDNGGEHYKVGADRSLLPCNYPLRDGKQSLYEGGIRVPFIVRGPRVKPGSFCHVPVAGYDILPTLYDLAGGRGPLPEEVDGGSLRNLIESGGHGSVSRVLPGLVFHRPLPEQFTQQSAIQVAGHKLVVNWKTGGKELFNLEQDIGERRDLAAAMPEKTAELQSLMMSYLKRVDAEMPPALKG